MNLIVLLSTYLFWVSVTAITHIINHIVTWKNFGSILIIFIQIIFDLDEINYNLICVQKVIELNYTYNISKLYNNGNILVDYNCI